MLTTRFLAVAIVIGLALAIAGVARSPAAAPAPDGTLTVREHQLPSDAVYIEGYVSFLRIRDNSGNAVVHRHFDVGDPQVHLRTDLPPGPYKVTRFIRPCDGNCEALDRATERCKATVEIAAGGRTRAIVRTRVGHRCRIRVR